MKRPLIIVFSIIAVFVILGVAMMSLLGPRVGSTFSTISNELPGYGGGGGAPEISLAPVEVPAAYDAASRQAVSNVAAAEERLVIENADLAIVVKDPKARMKEIADMAKEMGGFVVTSNLYQSSYGPNNIEVPEASITIRIPSQRLDEALEKIKKDVVDVDYENRTGQDVTNQYVDLQSQLRAKEAAAKKLLEIMDKAERAEDVLAIYLQVQAVQIEIEQLKGQIKYLEESAALSAVSVRLIAEESVRPIEIGGWKLQGTANDAIQDLITFTQGFTRFLIRFVLYTLPALILIALPFYGVFIGGRAVYRRFRKSKVRTEPVEEVKK